MMPQIRFAIIDSNTLACIGLQQILTDIMPIAEIVVFNSVEELLKMSDVPFVHYFVSSRIYFEHVQLFREQFTRTIVLVNGDLSIKNAYTLNICQSEKNLVKEIMALRSSGHHHVINLSNHSSSSQILSQREMEVAVLLCKGMINKEIADKLELGTTTVITHRKNIMDKLHAKSLADIIIYCIMNGIVNVEDL